MNPQEVTAIWQRIIALENKVNSAPIPTDYSKNISDLQQKVIYLENAVKMIGITLESHGQQLVSLRNRLDDLKKPFYKLF